MARLTPPVGAKGLFTLRLPFEANPTTVYQVSSQRSFADLINRNIDPIALAYTPAGLGDAEYQADLAEGAFIITLLSDSQKAMYVPDTYIDSYPNMAIVPHSHVVAVVSCGILPDTYDTTRLEAAISKAVSDDTGVESTVSIAVVPTTDAITQEQYAANLNARLAAIKNRSTDYADKLVLQTQLESASNQTAEMVLLIEQLQARIAELEGSAPGS